MSSAPLDPGMKAVVRLAWPTVLSFVLNNGYRLNDQYWIKDLGSAAQAAIGASTMVLIMNFAVIFLAVGGSLPLIARATGARRPDQRDDVIRHTVLLGVTIAGILSVVGWFLTPTIARLFDLEPETGRYMVKYLRTIYLLILPIVFAPIVDNTFIAMGNTKLPMMLQACAVTLNLILNPILIYGIGSWDGMGIMGAALATCASRTVTGFTGFLLLRRLYGVRIFHGADLRMSRVFEIARLGAPMALSIGFYAAVYFTLFAMVIGGLGRDVGAGFSIGFNGFESISYPFFLGLGLAGSSLVGRNLGADRPEDAWRAVHNVRRLGRTCGLAIALVFWFGAEYLVPFFTNDPGAMIEAVRYVTILGWSQLLVSEEVINEKILYGAGHPQAIFRISSLGNVLRIPLAWFFAVHQGYGAAGVWWTINATTLLKGLLFYLEVQRGRWVRPIGTAAPS